MNNVFDSLTVYLLLAAIGAGAGAFLSAGLYLSGSRRLKTCPPSLRQHLLLALLACPLLGALALVLSMSMPIAPAAALFAGGAEAAHCGNHPTLHHAWCQWHAPQIVLPGWLTALVSLIFTAWLGLAVRGVMRMLAAARRLGLMRNMGRWQADDGYWLLPLRRPLAFAAGLFGGQAFMSVGLREHLSHEQLAIVLEHEHSHIRHRDMLTSVLVSFLARLQAPRVARRIRADWALAVEQRCDDTVARTTGDRLAVADCLVAVARLQQDREPAVAGDHACHLLDDNLSARVTALLEEPPAPRRALVFVPAGLTTAAVMAALASGPQMHRWAELLLPLAAP